MQKRSWRRSSLCQSRAYCPSRSEHTGDTVTLKRGVPRTMRSNPREPPATRSRQRAIPRPPRKYRAMRAAQLTIVRELGSISSQVLRSREDLCGRRQDSGSDRFRIFDVQTCTGRNSPDRPVARQSLPTAHVAAASDVEQVSDESRHSGRVDTAIRLISGDNERPLCPTPFLMRQDAVFFVPG